MLNLKNEWHQIWISNEKKMQTHFLLWGRKLRKRIINSTFRVSQSYHHIQIEIKFPRSMSKLNSWNFRGISYKFGLWDFPRPRIKYHTENCTTLRFVAYQKKKCVAHHATTPVLQLFISLMSPNSLGRSSEKIWK